MVLLVSQRRTQNSHEFTAEKDSLYDHLRIYWDVVQSK